jgi:hypothetical protein
VLHEGDSGYSEAAPLGADIYQFWAWFVPLSRPVVGSPIRFESRIGLTGPIEPFDDGEEFRGSVMLRTSHPVRGAWLNTINKGLENLNDDIKSRLREDHAGQEHGGMEAGADMRQGMAELLRSYRLCLERYETQPEKAREHCSIYTYPQDKQYHSLRRNVGTASTMTAMGSPISRTMSAAPAPKISPRCPIAATASTTTATC